MPNKKGDQGVKAFSGSINDCNYKGRGFLKTVGIIATSDPTSIHINVPETYTTEDGKTSTEWLESNGSASLVTGHWKKRSRYVLFCFKLFMLINISKSSKANVNQGDISCSSKILIRYTQNAPKNYLRIGLLYQQRQLM